MLNIHIYPSPLTHESRILRITDALAEAGIFDSIEVLGVAAEGLPAREEVDAKRSLVRLSRKLLSNRDGFVAKLSKNIEWSLRVLSYVKGREVAAVNAHSLAVLPLCAVVSAITGAKLIYDTHELETETSGYKGFRQKFGKLIERIFIRRCDMIFVVSDSIADWYALEYNLTRPTIVRNIPQFKVDDSAERPVSIERLNLDKNKVLFIYQGGFIAGRGIERLLAVFAKLPEANLVCMGSGPLKDLVADAASRYRNIYLIPSVKPSEVLNYTKAADVGICLTDNSCLSHYYSLPNKIFEYLHAGLPIIVNPLKEQRRLVEENSCGWVAPKAEAEFIDLIASIDRQAIERCGRGVAQANRSLSWESEKKKLVEAYKATSRA
ncbi:glycosyltransferase involved in cell wall biosynthesis [Rhizobium sp. BK529]|uniref:glycosyltransferase n=1 Tax=unclassified Rhizobium TaxID=2613769 RepID=UPI00104F4F4E|nr:MULTISPECIES: glycosyltransferase [unclassified Rhizobium]MBB3593813.1 glycosyltransferase involved in cell wall biosynthesis [Rhizobium sp. BK529]TCS01271.1 glycosyltransferase involved in cell wall biosynthesis [Rhizobium sp. BK418]